MEDGRVGPAPRACATIPIEVLDERAFSEFGWVLGAPFAQDPAATAFSHPGSDFWHVHDFDPGEDGATEVLWVNYRDDSLRLRALEVHWLTEQAIVPLGGHELLHVVCPTRTDASRLPDLTRLRCFRIRSGLGICMRPGCWHASFVTGGHTTCLMLTRRSTTRDLVAHLKGAAFAVESSTVTLGSLGEGELRLKA
jgi:ureidoglycolate lyase